MADAAYHEGAKFERSVRRSPSYETDIKSSMPALRLTRAAIVLVSGSFDEELLYSLRALLRLFRPSVIVIWAGGQRRHLSKLVNDSRQHF